MWWVRHEGGSNEKINAVRTVAVWHIAIFIQSYHGCGKPNHSSF